MNNYFILFGNCLPVNGAVRSIVCDLQKNHYCFIPNVLFEILKKSKKRTVSQIIEEYGIDNKETILEYFNYLEEEGYGFYTNEPENFPEIKTKWETPSKITNVIIDIDEESNHDFNKIVKELDDLNCKAVEIRYHFSPSEKGLTQALDCFNNSGVNCLQIILSYSPLMKKRWVNKVISKYKRISSFLIYSSPKTEFHISKYHVRIHYMKEKIDPVEDCGCISPLNFSVNIEMFSESKNYNSCLNKKISIDKNGNIKNCPSMEKSYGKFNHVEFVDVIRKDDFKENWLTTKDQIDICKDCEFRYICSDCRVFIENKENKYSKPSKCKYNPYEAQFIN